MATLECQDETANPAIQVKWAHQVKQDVMANQAHQVKRE
jgi:hypothetical protein